MFGQVHLLRMPEPLMRMSAVSCWVVPSCCWTWMVHFPASSFQTVDDTLELNCTRSSRLYLTVVRLMYSQISDPAA